MVLLLPAATLPKLNVAGSRNSLAPAAAVSLVLPAGTADALAVTPVPARLSIWKELLLTTVRCPPTHPAAVGANVTVACNFAPAGRVFGSANSLTLKLALLERTSVICMFALLLLLMVTCCVRVCPTGKFPNGRLVVDKLKSFASARICRGRMITGTRAENKTTAWKRD